VSAEHIFVQDYNKHYYKYCYWNVIKLKSVFSGTLTALRRDNKDEDSGTVRDTDARRYQGHGRGLHTTIVHTGRRELAANDNQVNVISKGKYRQIYHLIVTATLCYSDRNDS
jgi:hypothetical protein